MPSRKGQCNEILNITYPSQSQDAHACAFDNRHELTTDLKIPVSSKWLPEFCLNYFIDYFKTTKKNANKYTATLIFSYTVGPHDMKNVISRFFYVH